MPSRTGRLALVAAAAALLTFANSLPNGHVHDDPRVIVDNPAIRDLTDWRRIVGTPSWFMEGESTSAYRPFTTWTFALDFALHGAEPLGYHVLNVALHALVSALVVALALAVGLPAAAAGLAGTLFAVHPIHTEVVANGVGRAELLAAVFALLTILLDRRAAGAARPAPAVLGAAAAYGLALLSKEHTIALLVVVPLTRLMLDDDGSAGRFLARLRGPRGMLCVLLGAVTLAYLALRVHVLGSVTGATTVAGRQSFVFNPAAAAPAALRILTALDVQAQALWLLAFPFRLSADYSYREVPLVTGPADPRALLGLLVALALVGALILSWRRSRLVCWCMLVGLLPWLVVSNLVLPIGTIFAERLLYLPSVGFCALVALALAQAAQRGRPLLAWAVAAILLVTWAARSAARNPVWRSDLTLARAMVVDAPESAVAHRYLGRVHARLGRTDEAIPALERAAHLLADHPDAPLRLDALYDEAAQRARRGEQERALALYGEVVARDPAYFPAWINLGALRNARREHRLALAAAERAAGLRPDLANVHVVRGVALRGLGRARDARAAFERALALAPESVDALVGVGAAAFDERDYARAAEAFERALAVAPSRDLYIGLTLSYRATGRSADAARIAAEGRRRHPDEPLLQPARE